MIEVIRALYNFLDQHGLDYDVEITIKVKNDSQKYAMETCIKRDLEHLTYQIEHKTYSINTLKIMNIPIKIETR